MGKRASPTLKIAGVFMERAQEVESERILKERLYIVEAADDNNPDDSDHNEDNDPDDNDEEEGEDPGDNEEEE